MASLSLQRAIDPLTLCTDPSVEHIGSHDLADWTKVASSYKAIRNLPINRAAKMYLKNHLFSSLRMEIIRINSPKILIYRFNNGEIRAFIITQHGFLVEHPDNCLWDPAFPFLKVSESSLEIQVPDNLPRLSPDSGYLWACPSPNFTHFLCDFYALFVIYFSICDTLKENSLEIPVFHRPVGWQSEYINLLSQIKPIYLADSLDSHGSNALWFCPKSITLPVFNNRPMITGFLREFFHQRFRREIETSTVEPLRDKVIFFTRYDERRLRIRNIDDIEDLVRSSGGHVIDPSPLTIAERIIMFSESPIIIAESSGCTNFAVFASDDSSLISLIEPSVIALPEFLVAGWTYMLEYAYRSQYIIGKNLAPLQGSPLGCADFSIDSIEASIKLAQNSKNSCRQ
jgi:capsular polysaccharide biosynthesis protein